MGGASAGNMASPEQYRVIGKHGVGGATLGKISFLVKNMYRTAVA